MKARCFKKTRDSELGHKLVETTWHGSERWMCKHGTTTHCSQNALLFLKHSLHYDCANPIAEPLPHPQELPCFQEVGDAAATVLVEISGQENALNQPIYAVCDMGILEFWLQSNYLLTPMGQDTCIIIINTVSKSQQLPKWMKL